MRTYLKDYEWNKFKLKYSRGALSAAEGGWSVPLSGLALCVRAARLSGGKTAAVSRGGLKEDFTYISLSFQTPDFR